MSRPLIYAVEHHRSLRRESAFCLETDDRLCLGVTQVITLTASERVMGKKFVNSRITTAAACLMAAFVVAINCYLVKLPPLHARAYSCQVSQ